MIRLYSVMVAVSSLLFPFLLYAQSTSWTGAVSTAWRNSFNWTNGVPSSTKDAIIGDGSFTGSFQPEIFRSATAKSLTLGGTRASTLTLSKNLTVSGAITINANGTMLQGKSTISLTGNWTNNGTFSATSNNASVIMTGIAQTIGGSATTTFRRLTINAGSTVTLAHAMNVTGSGSILTVDGTLNPGESTTYLVTAEAIIVNNNAILKVNATTFAGNYSVTPSLNAGSTVEYAATGNQTVSNALTYGTLRISGGGVKTLAGNLTNLASSLSTAGNIYVAAGTLNLSTFTANRGTTVAGGNVTVLNNATLRIGGTNGFPQNYATQSLSLGSTVEYVGNAQAVAATTYGNLTLQGTSGAVVKTFPATAFTITGNLSMAAGTASSVSFTPGAALTVSGNVSIGASTTFNGGSFSHTVNGNWVNNGTFTGSTGAVTFSGAGMQLSGAGVNNFNDINFTASNITAAGTTPLTVAGNFTTTGAGVFTHLSGGTITFTGSSKVITGTGIFFDNLTVSGSVSSSSSYTVTGNITVSGTLTHTTGTLTMSGTSKSISGSGTKVFYGLAATGTITTAVDFSVDSVLNVTGSLTATAGTATFRGSSSLSGTAGLFNVNLNGTSLQLSTNSVLGIAGAYSITAGTLDVASSVPNTVSFNGTGAQTVNGGTYHHLTLANGNTKTAGNNITVNGNITIATGTSFSGGNWVHTINGNWINNGTFTAGASTISFSGSLPVRVSGATTFSTLTINKSTATVVDLQSNISAGTVNMTSGLLNTGSNTLTITTTRNGNGVILGNIQRLHAFSAGTAYAFESPSNTITFSSISVAVPSVTVSVVKGGINDFPFGGAVNRQYTVSIPSGSYAAVLRLHYEDDELNGNAEAAMPLWNHSGAAWSNAGKTSNNTTDNYVELSGLSSLSTRWTLSDAPNVLRWTGGVSGDWNTAGNWTAVQGSPGTIPTANDIAEIGTAAFSNQPVITTAATAKSLLFGSVQPVTLTLGAGGTLATAGNILGQWSGNATHTIEVGAQSVTVSGDLILSDGVAGHAINLNIGTGSVSVSGAITQSGGANIVFAGAGTLSTAGNFNYVSGTFTPGTGTVIYNGANAQSVAGVNYYALTVNKSGGVASVNTAIPVSGSLTLQNGTLELRENVTVGANITSSSGSLITSGNITLSTGGNWAVSGNFTPGGGTVLINGTGAQSISAATFSNLVIDKSAGTATLTGNVGIASNLSVNAGTLDLRSYTASRNTPGGTFTLASGTTLLAGGAGFPGNYGTYNLSASSTVNYNGTGTQAVAGISYGNLLFSNGGANAKTLAGVAAVNGDLTISNGATFHAGGSYNIALNGNWVNNGSFVPSTSTILLNGTGKTITGNTTFNRVTIYGSYSVNNNDITYNGPLNITSTGSFAAGSGSATVNGDLINSGSLSSNGITTFTGTTVQTIRFLNAIVSNSAGVINFNGNVSPVLNSTSTPTYANLNINNTAGVNPSVDWLILGNFNIGSGAVFNGGLPTHHIKGNFSNNGTVTSTGTLWFNPTTPVAVNFGSSFSSTGKLILDGTAAIAITGTPVALNHVDIESTVGVTPPSGWTVSGNFVVNSNAIFNAGTYTYAVNGNVESNGTLNGGTSTFNMTGAASHVSGSTGTHFYNFTVTGGVIANTNFQVDHDFNNNGTFNATGGELIMTGSTPGSIGGSTNPSTIAHLNIHKENNVAVTLARNISAINSLRVTEGIFDVGAFTLSQDAIDLGELAVEDGGVLKIGGTNTLPVFDSYSLDTLSTVDYAGSTQSIATSVTYGNLAVSTAGTKTPGAALTMLHDFTLANGTFTGGNFTHLLGGDWTMTSGTFTNTGTTIQLNGVDSQVIASTGAFNVLTINKTGGPVVLGGAVTVNNSLNFTAGKLHLSNSNLTMGSAGTITGATAANYIVADGAGTLVQRVTNGGSKDFPIGTADQYIPATIALTAGSVTDNISARVLDNAYVNGDAGTAVTSGAVDATWIINEAVPGGSVATVTLQWPGVLELSGFTRSTSRLAHYIAGSWDYGAANIAATGTDPYVVSRAGFTSFSPFAVSTLNALPVTWLNVSGSNTGNDNEITWTTANETNNEYFSIEVSADSRDFEEAGRVPAASNPQSEQRYIFIHRNVPYREAWYRIKQVDADGRSSYSKTIRIMKGEKLRSELVYITNPASQTVTAMIQAERAYRANIIIMNATGRVIYRQPAPLNTGSNIVEINVGGYAAGTYLLQYIDEHGNRKVARFIKESATV
ncbi:MAG: T9SS type A sorting domain-containing protein [Agriterribacter sp.]